MAYPSSDSAADIMIRDAKTFYDHGWLFGTSGNLSLRIADDTFLVTASGRDKGRLSPEDFVACDVHDVATLADDTPADASAETPIHRAIYAQNPRAGAVYHVHDPYSAYCSERDQDIGATIMAGAEMIKALAGPDARRRARIPIIPNHRDVADIAAAIGEHLGAGGGPPGVNIRSHGIYAWGDAPAAAKRHVEALAYLFRYSWELGNGA